MTSMWNDIENKHKEVTELVDILRQMFREWCELYSVGDASSVGDMSVSDLLKTINHYRYVRKAG